MAAGEPARPARVWAGRLLWFVALWLAGVIVVGALALLIRTVLT